MSQLGKIMMLAGIVLLVAGAVVWRGGLPGDIVVRRGNFTLAFPIVTSIILSIVLSIVLALFFRR